MKLLRCFVLAAWVRLIMPASILASPNLLPEPGLTPTKGVPVNEPAIALTLEDCVRKAVLEGTPVLKSEYQMEFSGAQLLQAYGQFLPNFTGAANYGYGTGTTYSTVATPTYVTSSGTNASYAVSTDLNIFNGVSDQATLKSALLKYSAANLNLYRAKQQIKLDVIQSFYQVVLDHRLVDISESNLRTSRERERLFSAQVEVGQRHLSDYFQQQARTSAQELQLLSLRNTMLRDQLALLKRLRLDVTKRYLFIEPKLRTEVDIDKSKIRHKNPTRHGPPTPLTTLEDYAEIPDEKTLIEIALVDRMDLKATSELSDAENWDVRTATSGYLPKVDLVAGLTSGAHYLDSLMINGAEAVPVIQNNIAYQLGNQIQYTVGLTFTWTLFDRFLTHQSIIRLQTIAKDTALDLQDLKNTVEADVRQAYGNYITSIQQLRASAIGLEAAQKSYEVLEGRYSLGGVNLLDLLTGQDILVQAESSRAQALINFQLQNDALSFATGEMPIE